MYLILSASKDTYITNKIIENSFSASNANVGRASTLDLFRLYDESFLTGVNPTNELTRCLIKFDYGRLRTLMKSTLDVNSSNFKCKLKLFDIMGGQSTPSNFKLILFPLSQSFDEGIGRNVAAYSDLGTCNFATASYSNSTNNVWHLPGADAQGTIDSTATITAATADEFTFSGIGTENGTIKLISFDGDAAFTTKTYIGIADATDGTVQSDGSIAFDTGADAPASALGLKNAIESATGHDGKITVTRGNQALVGDSLELAQATAGIEGNTTITVGGDFNDACTVTAPPAKFTGGVSQYPTNIDVIVSGNLNDGDGTKGLGTIQKFVVGNENVDMDVTTVVSATLAGILPDYGFRLSFTGSEEQDTKTRFVKRLASRHVKNVAIRPRLDVMWDDSLLDNHKNFYFDLSGSLFLKNFHRGIPADILSGSSLAPVTGVNCMILTLQTGSWIQTISASQHQAGTKHTQPNSDDSTIQESYNYVTGVYSASFAMSSSDNAIVSFGTSFADMISRTGSIVFEEYWSSPDRLTGYHTGSLTVKRIPRTSFNVSPQSLDFIVINAQTSYRKSDKVMFRVFIKDFNEKHKSSRLPYKLPSIILEKVYYQVKDANSEEIFIPFETSVNGTRLSSDSEGMFFEMMMDLPVGRTYTFDFLSKDSGFDLVTAAKNVGFRVN